MQIRFHHNALTAKTILLMVGLESVTASLGRRQYIEWRTAVNNLIDRQAAINEAYSVVIDGETFDVVQVETLMGLPSAQPEQLSDAYMKAVWTWLLNYQIKSAELKGRYTPYEVLSWVVNDWRKEHE